LELQKKEYKIYAKVNIKNREIIRKTEQLPILLRREIRRRLKDKWFKIETLINLEINLDKITGFRLNNGKSIKRQLKLNKYFFRLLGFFCSEGYISNVKKGIDRKGVGIAIGKDDYKEVILCLKKLNLSYSIYKNGNVRDICLGNRIFAVLLKDILKCGEGSHSKRVPFIVWNTTINNQLNFLKAYLIGDGSIDEKRISCSTVSKQLCSDLILLIKNLNFSPSLSIVKEKLIFNKYIAKKQYIIHFTVNNNNISLRDNFFKIKLIPCKKYHYSSKMIPSDILRHFKKLNLKYNRELYTFLKGNTKKINWDYAYHLLDLIEKNKRLRWGKLWYNRNFLKTILNKEIEFLEIKKIEKRERKITEFVYDLTTEKNKNYISGFGGLIHHNCPYSYSCDGSIVLPLSDNQFLNFDKRMVELQSVLYGVQIQNRGLLVRTHNLSEDELKANTLKFLNYYK
jgi:hypothetical protein